MAPKPEKQPQQPQPKEGDPVKPDFAKAAGLMHQIAKEYDKVEHLTIFAENEKLDAKFAAIDGKFDEVNAKFDEVNAKFDQVNARIDKLDGKFEAKFDEVNAKFDEVNVKFNMLQSAINHGFQEIRSLIIDYMVTTDRKIKTATHNAAARQNNIFAASPESELTPLNSIHHNGPIENFPKNNREAMQMGERAVRGVLSDLGIAPEGSGPEMRRQMLIGAGRQFAIY